MLGVESLRIIFLPVAFYQMDRCLKVDRDFKGLLKNMKAWIANQGNKQYVFEKIKCVKFAANRSEKCNSEFKSVSTVLYTACFISGCFKD